MATPIIGIDLGTTYSCVACFDASTQSVAVIPSRHTQERTMPSWVGFNQTTKVVGTAAKQQAASNPTSTIYDVKRILGRSFHDPVVQDEIKNFPFVVVEGSYGEPKIQIPYKETTKLFNPEQISAFVLAELKLAAEQHLQTSITDAVITVPAHFNNQQRQATKDAGKIAGLNVRRIINEPTAAALAYGIHDSQKVESASSADSSSVEGGGMSNVIIFDLGGGTFDVTCLSLNEGVLEVKATGGDTHLGGEDFDQNITKWCVEQLQKSQGDVFITNLQQSNRALARLKKAVETAKRTLSTTQSVDIEVDSLLDSVDFSATLTRDLFEELNRDLFQRCLETVKSVLVDASVTLDEVTDVVLVGGSTRVPFLQSSLYDMFGGRIELCKSVHPDEAVAVGAAVQGHILAMGGTGGGQDLLTTTDLLLLDVTPLSLGIELQGRIMSTLIKRNTAIPCKKTRTYTTVEDWQTSIDVVVYEGERQSIDSNNKLGDFVISGVERAKAGEPKVDVTFALDANGILSVSARDQVTEAEAKATIKAEKGRLSPEEVDRMVAEAEQFLAEDEEYAAKMSYKTALEEALFSAQSKAVEETDMRELEEMMDWIELDSDTATVGDMQERGRVLEDKYGVVVSTA